METITVFDYNTLPTILKVLEGKYIGSYIKVHRFIADPKDSQDEDMYAIPPELIIQNNCKVESTDCEIIDITQNIENGWATYLFVVNYNGKTVKVQYPLNDWIDYEDEEDN